MEMAAELQEVGTRSYEQAEFWVSQCQRRAHTTLVSELVTSLCQQFSWEETVCILPTNDPKSL